MLSNKLFSSIGNTDRLYVDDVFSAYTYTGNGPSQTINNGIDLAGKGGMVWSKKRAAQYANYLDGHRIQDTTRGAGVFIDSSATKASSVSGGGSFLSNGLVMAGDGATTSNGHQFISWTFRKAPKFFDVVTYTGDGAASRSIAHSLGVAPGMIIVKRTALSTNWFVWHKDQSGKAAYLNTTNAFFNAGSAIASVSSTHFVTSAADATDYNNNGDTYVAYLFAHDTTADGIVQCGSYVGNAGVSVNLGWEPQYVLAKAAGTTSDWFIVDSSRGMPVGTAEAGLYANTSAEESGLNLLDIAATGFTNNAGLGAATIIYLAIRRPNKPPTTGTQVYNAIARTGTGTAPVDIDAGFSPDLISVFNRDSGQSCTWVDKLRGASPQLFTDGSYAEFVGFSGITQFLPTGVSIYDAPGTADMNQLGFEYINHFFKRAPGFFDVVCDTGTGTAHAITHNMTVAPELVIRKGRSGSTQWDCWHAGIANTEKLVLNSTAAKATDTTAWNSTSPTTASFTVGTGANVNTNAATYVTYLFASLPGISKVGSYTGNNASQTINCGFTTGARFVLIKRTDAAGDWYIWDTARGIVASNDPHLSLNTTAGEVTTNDSVDPNSTGFIVNQVAATNINVNGATYIFLSIA